MVKDGGRVEEKNWIVDLVLWFAIQNQVQNETDGFQNFLELAKTVTGDSGFSWNPRLETTLKFCHANPEFFPKKINKGIDLTSLEKTKPIFGKKFNQNDSWSANHQTGKTS